jgi:TPR repeat protein
MGSAEGCQARHFLRARHGVIQNSTNAVSYYRQACGLGRQSSCVKLGTLYENGQGVSQDRGRAAALYLQACQELDANGCVLLGNMYENGRGVDHDPDRAAALYRRACEIGNVHACRVPLPGDRSTFENP